MITRKDCRCVSQSKEARKEVSKVALSARSSLQLPPRASLSGHARRRVPCRGARLRLARRALLFRPGELARAVCRGAGAGAQADRWLRGGGWRRGVASIAGAAVVPARQGDDAGRGGPRLARGGGAARRCGQARSFAHRRVELPGRVLLASERAGDRPLHLRVRTRAREVGGHAAAALDAPAHHGAERARGPRVPPRRERAPRHGVGASRCGRRQVLARARLRTSRVLPRRDTDGGGAAPRAQGSIAGEPRRRRRRHHHHHRHHRRRRHHHRRRTHRYGRGFACGRWRTCW